METNLRYIPRDYDTSIAGVHLLLDRQKSRAYAVGVQHGRNGRPIDYVWEWSSDYRRGHRDGMVATAP